MFCRLSFVLSISVHQYFFPSNFKSEGFFSSLLFSNEYLGGLSEKLFFDHGVQKQRIKGRWSTLCLFGFQFSTLGVGFFPTFGKFSTVGVEFFQLLVNFPLWVSGIF